MSTETGFGIGAAPQPAPESKQSEFSTLQLQNAARSGANWFFWIAGLSAVNTGLHLSGSDTSFIVGLGVTQILDLIGRETGSVGAAVSLILNAVVLGIFVLFGVFARKRNTWAFVLGMSIYALDAVIYVLGSDWLGVGFHALVLFFLWGGLKAHRKLRALEALQPKTIP
jgi:hypothetical protein